VKRVGPIAEMRHNIDVVFWDIKCT